MRYKAWHFLNPGKFDNKETSGFRTTSQSPKIVEMKEFENDIFNILNKVEFRNIQSTF